MVAPFPDVKAALRVLLADLGETGTFTPIDLRDRMPFLLVYRFAGADDRVTDTARVGIDVFTGTYTAGEFLAEQVRQRVIAAPHRIQTDTGVVVIDDAITDSAPVEVPYGDSAIRRWVASYRVTYRR